MTYIKLCLHLAQEKIVRNVKFYLYVTQAKIMSYIKVYNK
jgi:hypothetical protein